MAERQAGGTDVQDRLRRGTSRGPVVALRPADAPDRIAWHDGRATIGALVRLATIASDAQIVGAYPGLAAAAGGLATPQIRAVATTGGALLQRTRCWYFRDPDVSCFKKGGTTCPAREGDHTFGVCFDLGPCVWPHPSTLGAALLAYEAEVTCEPGGTMAIGNLFGDGSDPTRDHTLTESQILTSVTLGTPVPGERAGYLRIIGRQLAEWPLIEVVVRLVVEDGRITFARVAIGAVATVPLRFVDLEDAMIGSEADPAAVERIATNTVRASRTLEATRYKLELLPVAVADTVAKALAAASSPDVFQASWALPWTGR
jgi:xanthine dehydrogenase YagS FAD-binding subunit